MLAGVFGPDQPLGRPVAQADAEPDVRQADNWRGASSWTRRRVTSAAGRNACPLDRPLPCESRRFPPLHTRREGSCLSRWIDMQRKGFRRDAHLALGASDRSRGGRKPALTWGFIDSSWCGMFPMTHHVECVAILEPATRRSDLRFSWVPQAWKVLLDPISEVREVEHAAFGECL